MNDADLRQRLDALTTRVPAQPDAYGLVQTRATRIRRRRGSAALAGLLVVVAGAVAIPEALQHQTESLSPSVGVGLSATCDPAAVRAAAQYGTVDRMYGEVTTASALAAWRARIGGGGSSDTLPASTPVPLCLLVGSLDGPAGDLGDHYALLSVVGGAVEGVYTGPNIPGTEPMPGVARSQIVLWSGPVATPGPVVATTASATPLTAAPPARPGAASSVAAVLVPPCRSHDVSGALRGVAAVDGALQGAIEISTTSAAGCVVRGNLHMAPLTSIGTALPVPPGGLAGPTDGVYAPTPVDVVLAPLSAGHSSPEEHAGQILEVIVGVDGGTACGAKDRQTRPASFRLTIGTMVVTVKNLDAASSDTGKQSLVGCPGRFYAGSASLQ